MTFSQELCESNDLLSPMFGADPILFLYGRRISESLKKKIQSFFVAQMSLWAEIAWNRRSVFRTLSHSRVHSLATPCSLCKRAYSLTHLFTHDLVVDLWKSRNWMRQFYPVLAHCGLSVVDQKIHISFWFFLWQPDPRFVGRPKEHNLFVKQYVLITVLRILICAKYHRIWFQTLSLPGKPKMKIDRKR